MSARDDYPKLNYETSGPHRQGATSAEAQAALDEIDRLRAENVAFRQQFMEADEIAAELAQWTGTEGTLPEGWTMTSYLAERDAAEADADRLAAIGEFASHAVLSWGDLAGELSQAAAVPLPVGWDYETDVDRIDAAIDAHADAVAKRGPR